MSPVRMACGSARQVRSSYSPRMKRAQARIEPGPSLRKVATSGVSRVATIVRLMHNVGGEGTHKTWGRARMRGGGTGEPRDVLSLFAEMVRETEFPRGVDHLGDPAGCQKAVHGRL